MNLHELAMEKKILKQIWLPASWEKKTGKLKKNVL